MVLKARGPDPAGEAGAGGSALHVAVDEELEAIFAALPPSHVAPGSAASPVTSVRPREGAARHVSRWGAAAAGLLLLAAVGAGFVRREANPPPPVLQPQIVSAELAPQALPEPLVLARRVEPPPPKPALTKVAQSQPRPRTRATARREVGQARSGCARYRGEALARCLWPDVMQADRELRRAYDRAARDGVARSMMVSFRNRWSDLRHDARREPEKVITAYRRMTSDLDGARGRVADG
jgi:hypothetical protein